MSKQTYWDSESRSTITSEREYEETEVQGVVRVEPGYGQGDRAVTLYVLLDTTTGLLVGDVGAYERWLTK